MSRLTWRFPGKLSSRTRQRRPHLYIALVFFVLLYSIPSSRYAFRNRLETFVYFISGQGKPSRPPTYEKLRQWEYDLPQHDLDLPFPEGKTGRYVKFSNQITQLGWNNVLNDVLMSAHLAYASKRAYVFQDYTWNAAHYPWPKYKSRDWPPRTPLNALIYGPTSGGLWSAGDDAPRSISDKWFDIVCPKATRRIINTRDVKPAVQSSLGIEVFTHWKNILLEAPELCIEVVAASWKEDGHPQTFDLWLWGSDRILSLWENFSTSPTSQLLRTSPIVNAAVARNEYLFLPQGPRPAHPVSTDPYDRMLAMHIRRGDYNEACVHLAKWNSTFYSWNLLEALPDPFVPPSGGSWGWNTPENTAKYMEHCLPTFDAIVRKVRESRLEYINAAPVGTQRRTLDVVFLLTNDRSEWLAQVKRALREDGWNTIVTSADLELDQEQIDVNMAVDMDIARRAAVFIGNGWSSFTSSIVHRRLVDGKPPISNRFF